MDRMLTAVAKLAGTSSRNDDDVIDRLHNRYTVLCLVIFAVVVSTNQYVGTPINCWAPAYFTDNHQRYADRVRFRHPAVHVRLQNLGSGVRQGLWETAVFQFHWDPGAKLS